MNHASKLVVLSIYSAVGLSIATLSASVSAATQAQAQPGTKNPYLIVEQVRTAVHAGALDRAGRLLLEGMVEAKGCSAKARIATDPAARSAAIYAEDGGPATGAEGVDGQLAWSRDASGVARRATFLPDAQNLVSDAYWTTGGLANTHWPAQVRYETSAKLGTDQADILEVTPAGGKSTEVWISQKSHLPLQWQRRDETGQVVTAYADYRNVAGAMIPFQQTVTDSDGNAHKYTVQSAIAHADPSTVASLLQMPAQAPADFEIHGARSTTVPMRMAGQPYIDVYIDGRGPFNFLVDTGGRLTLSTQTAQKLGVPLFGRADTAANPSQDKNPATQQYAMLADVRIGDAHVHQQNVLVRDLGRSRAGLLHRRVDGVIGSEIMERFVATLDYPNQQLTLSLDPLDRTPAANLAAATAPKHLQAIEPACISGAAGHISVDGLRAGMVRVASPVRADKLPTYRRGSQTAFHAPWDTGMPASRMGAPLAGTA